MPIASGFLFLGWSLLWILSSSFVCYYRSDDEGFPRVDQFAPHLYKTDMFEIWSVWKASIYGLKGFSPAHLFAILVLMMKAFPVWINSLLISTKHICSRSDLFERLLSRRLKVASGGFEGLSEVRSCRVMKPWIQKIVRSILNH